MDNLDNLFGQPTRRDLLRCGLGAEGDFVVLARGSGDSASRTLFRLMFRPQM